MIWTEKQAKRKVEEMGEALPRQALAAFFVELKSQTKWSSSDIEKFEAAYHSEVKRFDVTDSIRSQQFQVTVDLPGEIVAHSAGGEIDGSDIVWSFNGEFLCDRTWTLMATSKLPVAPDR